MRTSNIHSRNSLILLIASLATIGQPKAASADKLKVTEEFGKGMLNGTRTTLTNEVMSNCGDADPNTNVRLIVRAGANTFTGIIEGSTSKVDNRILSDTCNAGSSYSDYRTLYFFESVTVAGRSGGAVLEHVGAARTIGGVSSVDGQLRFLCGTGDLKHIHGVGIAQSTNNLVRHAYTMSVHFGHEHDNGFGFLCQDLDNGDSS